MADQNDQRRFLVWTEGGTRREQAMPERGSLTLGSDPGDGQVLRLDHPDVDDAHCVLGRTKTGGWAIKDLGSHTGTRINGETKAGARLRRGDRIELGRVALTFVGADDDGRPELPQEPAPAAADAKTARRLGGFRIEERLGRGGMGEVLAAVQESLARKVALKLLSPKLSSDEDFVRRFQAEARAAAALNHPNVVHVYDVGVVEGQHYLAMEFMAGGTLEGRLKAEGPIPPEQVVAVLDQTAQALVYAEDRGIVHRDIKPENLMLDGAGTVKLADLGLATTIEAEHREDDQRILGTPHFMAPEQARGGKVDHRSDLYALGATAFRLLTGETVFRGETTRDILRAHFTEPPRTPSSVRPGIPAGLDALVLRLLEKEPEARFGSARELATALEGLTAEAPATGGSKLPLVLGGVAVVALASLAAWKVLGDDPAPPVDPDGGRTELVGTEGPGPDEPEVPALPGIPVVEEGQPTDDDRVLEDLERLARQAYGGLAPITDPASRKTALEELAASFPGTTTATEALDEAAALAEQVSSEAQAAAARAAEQERLVKTLGTIFDQAERLADGAPAAPAGLLRQLLDAPAPSDAALATAFEAERARQLARVVDGAKGHAEAELARAEALAQAGDFDGYAETLGGLLPYFDEAPLQPTPVEEAPVAPEAPTTEPDAPEQPGIGGAAGNPSDSRRLVLPQDGGLPELPDGLPEEVAAELEELLALAGQTAPLEDQALLDQAGWQEFRALGERAAQLLAERPAREATYRAAEAAADRARLAQATGSSLLGELGALRPGAAATRLEALADQLDTQAARDAVARLAREARQAQAALALLISSHGTGDHGWRRDSVPDPAGGYLEALAVGADGITVQSDSGGRLIPWASFGGDPRLVDQLFKNRLRRDYTPEELLGIAALARFGAVLGAIAEADRVLVPSERERFDEGHREDLLGLFDLASGWCQAPEAQAADLREHAAADLLARALLARTSADPTAATAALSELLDDHRHSLLVLLLSDGRGPAPDGAEDL